MLIRVSVKRCFIDMNKNREVIPYNFIGYYNAKIWRLFTYLATNNEPLASLNTNGPATCYGNSFQKYKT